MSEKFSGKWALVTGSSRGIGRQIALGLASRGVNLIVHGRTPEHLETTLALLASTGVQVKSVAGKMDSQAEVLELIRQVKNICNSVDILYANHGIQNTWKDVWEITQEEWASVFQINFFSIVTLCNALIPDMIQRGYGRVILTTSGIPDIPQLTPYGSSKAAIDKYTFDMAAQLKESGVTIHAMDPGWLRTDLGGPDGMFPVEAVLPGALVPVITDVLESGRVFSAQHYRGL